MADIKLAKPYAAENYLKSLDNLTKRYQDNDGKVHFQDAAFDGLSEDQARTALKFFGDVGLIEIPKQGHYVPPQEVVTWQRSIEGPARQKAIEKVVDRLENEYKIFKEVVFLITNSEEEKTVSDLSREIGGKLGLSEDDLSRIERTIEVFSECGFFDIGPENVVSATNYVVDQEKVDSDSIDNDPDTTSDEEVDDSNQPGEQSSLSFDGHSSNQPDETKDREEVSPKSESFNLELAIEMDATDMDPDDLEEKLKIIESITTNAEK